ncbi:ABC transporter ATP-binding protein [Calidifontimicrobium sp. SYSU G02091]|uniref:ABC transporter ATP-binding protein n=1 Tax=Calidifontimicrobium sp. SYSU G02091 TaxID=2926421 RepID=UPI003FA437D5
MDMPALQGLVPTITPVGEVVLEADRVEKTYPNGTHALDRATVKIHRGEFVSLLGPSGCGKSTLLKMFAGLETPSTGRIVLHDGEDAAGPRSGHRSMAMVFQEATLMPWARVDDNVRLPLDLAGVPKSESLPRVREALELVGLSQFARVYPRELSGGMQMRVSIARALAVQPSILLMDEPFGALDEFTRNKLDSDLHELWRERGLTVVFVTHSIYEAVFLSSRVVVMAARPGRVIADVPIRAPERRDDSYRVSQPFIDDCRVLSDHLARANRGER